MAVVVPWKRWWVIGWAVDAALLITLAFFMPMRPWSIIVAFGFGIPEYIGVHYGQRWGTPPLTHVIHRYLPEWLTFPLIYGILGAAAAGWLELKHPIRLGLLTGLLGWLTEHFLLTYQGGKTWLPKS